MATADIEKGDKVSWNWGGGAPAGTVAETKDQGEIAIKSQRGNTVKRKADPSNPAVRIERSGNDVVKRASELTVEIKSSRGRDGKGQGKKRKANGQDPGEDSDEEEGDDEEGGDSSGENELNEYDDDEPHIKNKQGKEVKKGGKQANKKQKRVQEVRSKNEDNGKDENNNEGEGNQEHGDDEEDEYEDTDDIDDDDKEEGENEKLGSDKDEKRTAPRRKGDRIGTRTRSENKK
ncbi:hypothetical protein AAE478_010021 [Parahypoxylon ruwenzoriense]